MQAYEFDRDHCRERVITQGGTLRVFLDPVAVSGEHLLLKARYSGKTPGITNDFGVNKLTPEWTELGLYTPWYPYTDFQTLITYSITVATDPRYVVTSLGRMVIIAAPKLYSLRSPNFEPAVTVQYTDPRLLSQAQFYVDEGSWLLDFY